MKIFFDIGHPAHVHYFKNMIWKLDKSKNQIIISARDKDITFNLLNNYGIPYINRGKGSSHLIGKLYYLLKTNIKLYKTCLNEIPDLFIGFGSPYAAQVAFLLNKPSIILDDTENAKLGQLFYRYFATAILSPSTFAPDFGQKHIKFNGYMELTYLHNKYFIPNPNVMEKLGVKPKEKYSILRFVSWKANHDLGHTGISEKNKVRAIQEFSKYGKVFISSEKNLGKNLEKYKFDLHPSEMHDAIYYADLVFGESATMSSEAAVLGTHSIYVDSAGRGYTNEQEKQYNLVFNYSESEEQQEQAITKGIELLKDESSKKRAMQKSKKLIASKIDVTKFLTKFIYHYPNSIYNYSEYNC